MEKMMRNMMAGMLAVAGLALTGCQSSESAISGGVGSSAVKTPIPTSVMKNLPSLAEVKSKSELMQLPHSVSEKDGKDTRNYIFYSGVNGIVSSMKYVQLESVPGVSFGNGQKDGYGLEETDEEGATLVNLSPNYKIEVDEQTERIYVLIPGQDVVAQQGIDEKNKIIKWKDIVDNPKKTVALVYNLEGKFLKRVEYSNSYLSATLDRKNHQWILCSSDHIDICDKDGDLVRSAELPYLCKAVVPSGDGWFCIPEYEKGYKMLFNVDSKKPLSEKKLDKLYEKYANDSILRENFIPIYRNGKYSAAGCEDAVGAYFCDENFQPVSGLAKITDINSKILINSLGGQMVANNVVVAGKDYDANKAIISNSHFDETPELITSPNGGIYITFNDTVWQVRQSSIVPMAVIGRDTYPWDYVQHISEHFLANTESEFTSRSTGKRFANDEQYRVVGIPWPKVIVDATATDTLQESLDDMLLESAWELKSFTLSDKMVGSIHPYDLLSYIASRSNKFTESDAKRVHDIDVKGGPVIMLIDLKPESQWKTYTPEEMDRLRKEYNERLLQGLP